MGELLRIADPWGDEVVLTHEKWDYICGKHPVVTPHLACVEKTICRPEVVYEGRLSFTSKVFYKGGLIVDGPERGCWFVVVVRYTTHPATISTCYAARRMEGRLGNVLKMDR